jgi:hypothetical protein
MFREPPDENRTEHHSLYIRGLALGHLQMGYRIWLVYVPTINVVPKEAGCWSTGWSSRHVTRKCRRGTVIYLLVAAHASSSVKLAVPSLLPSKCVQNSPERSRSALNHLLFGLYLALSRRIPNGLPSLYSGSYQSLWYMASADIVSSQHA